MAPNQQPPHPERREGEERRAPSIRPRQPRRPKRRHFSEPDKKKDPVRRKFSRHYSAETSQRAVTRGDASERVTSASARAGENVRIYDTIIEPIISEKSYRLIADNVYTFNVDPKANKSEIKIAVEKLFGVKVSSVNTLNRSGKRVRTRDGYGQRASTKRAIVTLAPGSKPLDLFN